MTQTKLGHYRGSLRHMGVEIEHRNRIIRTLTSFVREANQSAEPADLLKLTLSRALQTTHADAGAVILFDRDSEQLTVGAQSGMTDELLVILTGRQLDEGAALLMPHLVTGEGALLERTELAEDRERYLLDAGRLNSLASLPMQAGGRLLGALVVGNRSRASFLPANLYALLAIAQEAAVAWETLQLRDSLWQMAEMFLAKDSSTSKRNGAATKMAAPESSRSPASLQRRLADMTAAIGGSMAAILRLGSGNGVPEVELVASHGLSSRFTRQFARSRLSEDLFPFAQLARRNLLVRELGIVNATHAIPLLVSLEEEGAQSLLALHLAGNTTDPAETVIFVAASTRGAFSAIQAEQLTTRAQELRPLISTAAGVIPGSHDLSRHTLLSPVEATDDEVGMLLEAIESVEGHESPSLISSQLIEEINGLLIEK